MLIFRVNNVFCTEIDFEAYKQWIFNEIQKAYIYILNIKFYIQFEEI